MQIWKDPRTILNLIPTPKIAHFGPPKQQTYDICFSLLLKAFLICFFSGFHFWLVSDEVKTNWLPILVYCAYFVLNEMIPGDGRRGSFGKQLWLLVALYREFHQGKTKNENKLVLNDDSPLQIFSKAVFSRNSVVEQTHNKLMFLDQLTPNVSPIEYKN